MQAWMKCLVVVFTAAALAGCATYESVPYDRTSGPAVKKIGMLPIQTREDPNAYLASSVGRSFGLIGVIVDASMQANREDSLKSILSARDFHAGHKLEEKLTASLVAQGYEVEIVQPTNDGKNEDRETAEIVKELNGLYDVDAYLQVTVPVWGYSAAGIQDSTPYRPIVYTNNALVSAADGAILMKDSVLYNPLNAGNNKYVTLTADPAYQFTTFSDLEAAPDKAVEGLDLSFTKTAEAIGVLLR